MDLQELLSKQFYGEVKTRQGLHSEILNNYSTLKIDQILSIQQTSQDPIIQKFLSALIITKLEEESPKGFQYNTLLSNGNELLKYAPEHVQAITDSCDSILISEVNEAKNEMEVMNWCYHGKLIRENSGKELNGMTLGYIDFVTFLWNRAVEICNSPNGELILTVLYSLYYGQNTLKFSNLDALILAIGGSALNYIDEKNNIDGLGNENTQRDIQEAHKILSYLEMLKIDDDTFIEEVKVMRTKCVNIEAPINIQEPVSVNDPNLVQIRADSDYSSLPDDQITQINASDVRKIDPPLYAIKSTYFQVCIYKAIYNNSEVAVKMYQSVHHQSDWTKIYKEIRIYQKLSSLSNNENCFLKYYGTYADPNSINMVMEYYPDNLMKYLTHINSVNYKFTEELIGPILYKLLASFKIMKDQGIFHSDIKPQNFLVDSFWNIKIIDFSISMVKNEDITSTATGNFPIQGTEGYTSPEIEKARLAKGQSAFLNPEKSDVFSLGLVFLQIFTTDSIKGYNTDDKKQELLEKINSLPFEWARRLLNKMLDFDIKTRGDFTMLLNLIPIGITRTMNRIS
ncbi:hypothetical protein SteCoe_7951 [Stentor coeruleus]|uniref:Protein kinase domain-containing protein n=1 Tax=Stentor coeruleus TaxID=5963 RepID=A0A1R2CLF4_9CILI|nr:hypothetical protein SteCoe_7951 [Stentor coeruleus]